MRKFVLCASGFLILLAGLGVLKNSQKADVLSSQSDVKLQYGGPLYVGGGEWERTYSAPTIKILTANKRKQNLVVQSQNNAGIKSNAKDLAHKPQTARKSDMSGSVKGHLKLDKTSLSLERLPSEISNGIYSIFRIHDNPVTMRSPIKILDHV